MQMNSMNFIETDTVSTSTKTTELPAISKRNPQLQYAINMQSI